MLITFIRTVIIFVTLMVLMRLMGKRQIGEMQSFELIITLIIADLAVIPMADVSIPLIYGVVAILAVFILHQLLSVLEKGGDFFKKIINGKPSVVINKNGVDFKELKKNNLDVEDLIEAMRGAGYFSLNDVDYAIFESNGKLSALEKPDFDKTDRSLSVLLIDEGKVNETNLSKLGKDKEWVNSILAQRETSLKQVGVMTVDGNGKAYLQSYKKGYSVFDLDLGGRRW